jgi:hypothetical protein
VEWNWQGKTEVLGEKPVPVPLCPPQIPHRLTRDRTRAFAVGGRRLTAWAMARPCCTLSVRTRMCVVIIVMVTLNNCLLQWFEHKWHLTTVYIFIYKDI